MKRFLSSLVAAFVFAGSASACLNDSELPTHEREFRSSYKRQAPPESPTDSQMFPPNMVPVALGGGGALLLIGAGLVTLRRSPKG
jgi:hypothetical protein